MEPDKVKAVYELREAAEQHGRTEERVRERHDHSARRELLDSRLRLEAKTNQAIQACHYCGRNHPDDEPHGGNVIEGNFGA